MAKLSIVKASVDVSVYIFIQNSSLTTGAGLTGLVFNSASLVCYYVRPLAAAAALTLATQTVTGAHSDGGFVEVDATNMPGVYRLDLSDAVCATGVNSVVVMLKGATNMAPVLLEIQLTNFDLNSANPNVNVTQISGDSAAADNAEAFFDGTGYAGTGNTIPTVTTVTNRVTANVDQLAGVTQSLTDLKDFADDGYDPATNKVQGVVLTDTVTTYTGNTPQTGDGFARLGAPAGASVSADIAAIEAQLDKLIIVSGTADSGSTTTMIDASRTEADNDYWKGAIIRFTSGNISGQTRIITDFVAATDTFTFVPATTQAVSTQDYVILPGISVWDDILAEHLLAGSTGFALNAAGAAGDPWSTALPGAYGAGTAGKIVGDNVNATISSRASQASVDTIDDFLDTEIAAIKAKTDNLPSDPADASDIASSFTTVNGKLDTIDDFLDTEVAAIKAKTDNLPSDPADESSIQATLTTIAGYIDTEIASILAAVDTEVGAIKTKTDSLTFTTANQVDSNALAIDSSTAAATHLKDHSLTAVPVTFSGGTTITAVLVNVDGAAASSVDDFYNGRVLIFTAPSGLKYQATDITDYVGATKTATITAVTTAVGATTTAIMV